MTEASLEYHREHALGYREPKFPHYTIFRFHNFQDHLSITGSMHLVTVNPSSMKHGDVEAPLPPFSRSLEYYKEHALGYC